MRSHFELAETSHECLAVVTFVGPHGGTLVLAMPAPEHLKCGLALSGATGMGDFHIHNQAVEVFHQDVPHVAQTGFVALGFLVQAGIAVRAAGVGVVAAGLALEIQLLFK